MYLDFYGLTREPFHITPDPEFLYLSPSHKEAFATILYGVDKRKGFVAVTGEVGTGKTTILRAYMEQLSSTDIRPIYLFDPALSFEELLEAMLNELGMRAAKRSEFAKLQWLRWYLIQEFKQDHNIALLIDEAQNMPVETMERLRILSNVETTKEKLIQIVLVGQPELEAKLRHPNLRQLNDRIAVRAVIRPLSNEESADYINHRLTQSGGNPDLILSPAALKRIVKHAGGIPRRLNILCDNALVAGFGAHRRPVPGSVVNEVVADMQGHDRRSWLRKTAPAAAGILVAGVIGFAAWNSLSGSSNGYPPRASSPEPAVIEPAQTPDPVPAASAGGAESTTPQSIPEPSAAPASDKAFVSQPLEESSPMPPTGEVPPMAAETSAPPPLETPVETPAMPEAEPPAAPAAPETLATAVPMAPEAPALPVESARPETPVAPETAPAPVETALAVPPPPAAGPAKTPGPKMQTAPGLEVQAPPAMIAAAAAPETTAAAAPESGPSKVRRVEKGDSLTQLLRSVYGVANRELMNEVVKNNPRIQDPDLIYYGDKIVFPALEPSAAGDGGATPAPADKADSQRSEP